MSTYRVGAVPVIPQGPGKPLPSIWFCHRDPEPAPVCDWRYPTEVNITSYGVLLGSYNLCFASD